MGKKTRKNTIITKIAVATFIAVFSLASAFAGTIAWFSSNKSATVTGGSFTVQTPTGIGFELYYLSGFDTNDDGSINNYGNYKAGYGFIGYEVSVGTAIFQKATVNEEGLVTDGSTNIEDLWPAHRLTFALVIETDSFQTFSLDSLTEDVKEGYQRATSKMLNPNYDPQNEEPEYLSNPTSITWAINMYGCAYHLTSSGDSDNNILADISRGFNTFKNVSTDKFVFSQDNPYEDSQVDIADGGNNIVDIDNDNLNRIILYFSILFSNEPSTFYRLENDGYYYKNSLGNSNCYKGLVFSDLTFNLA